MSEPIPQPSYVCVVCGYDTAQARPERCPECGKQPTESDFAAAEFRARVMAVRRKVLRFTCVWAFLAGTVAATVEVLFLKLGGSQAFLSVRASATIAVLFGGASLASVGLGWIACRFASPNDRSIAFIVWCGSLHWIHLAWLVTYGGFGLALIVGVIEGRLHGPASTLGPLVVKSTVLASFVAALISLPAWSAKWSALNEALRIRRNRARWLMFILGHTLMLVAWFLALIGGVTAAHDAERVFSTIGS